MEKEYKRDSEIGKCYLRQFFGSEPNGERREDETFKIAIEKKRIMKGNTKITRKNTNKS